MLNYGRDELHSSYAPRCYWSMKNVHRLIKAHNVMTQARKHLESMCFNQPASTQYEYPQATEIKSQMQLVRHTRCRYLLKQLQR